MVKYFQILSDIFLLTHIWTPLPVMCTCICNICESLTVIAVMKYSVLHHLYTWSEEWDWNISSLDTIIHLGNYSVYFQNFLSGFKGTAQMSMNAVVSGFPSFKILGPSNGDMGVLEYAGLFIRERIVLTK